MQITLVHTNNVHSSLDAWLRTAATVKAVLAASAENGRPDLPGALTPLRSRGYSYVMATYSPTLEAPRQRR